MATIIIGSNGLTLDRQGRVVAAGDVSADLLRRQIEEWRFAGDGHRLLEAPHLQHQVYGDGSSDFEPDIRTHMLPEPRERRPHLVNAGNEPGHEVGAVGVADRLTKGAGVLIADGEGCAGQDGVLSIEHDAAQF